MNALKLTWTWTLDSVLHAGSGLSNLAIADRLIQVDAKGNPAIFGDLVKGALRMSAEQVVAWLLKQPHDYKQNTPAEPVNAVLAAIFGGEADAHFSGRVLKRQAPATVAATAIDARTGTAKGETLRRTQFLPKGATVEASATIWLRTDSNVPTGVLETLLVAAIAATEAIGGKAGIGWGRVSLGGMQTELTKVDSKSLQTLTAALLATPIVRRSRSALTPHALQSPAWFKLTFTLDDPACFPTLPETSNHQDTSLFVPATTLRGACFSAWERSGLAASAGEWLGPESRWTPAFPTLGQDVWFPSPKGWTRLRTGGPLHNPLSGAELPAVEPAKRVAADGWVAKTEFDAQPVVTQTRMHVARDYVTGSKRTGALYSRADVAGGTCFTAWVHTSEAAVASLTKDTRLWVGRRTSVGGGAKLDEVTKTKPAWPETQAVELEEKSDVVVQLASPTLFRGADGLPSLSLDAAVWSKWAGQRCAVTAAFTRSVRRGGWMRQWGHHRPPVRMLDAGSTWHLTFDSPTAAAAARAALRASRFVGEGHHEGLGLILVDAVWSRIQAQARSVTTLAPVGSGLDPRRDSLALGALGMQVSPDAEKPLQQVATWLRSADDHAAVQAIWDRLTALANRFADRHRRNIWRDLFDAEKSVRKFLDDAYTGGGNSVAHLRFAVDALLIRAAKGRES